MDEYETKCRYNIAETCCASISLDRLRDICEEKDGQVLETSRVLNYGAIRGSAPLRENLSRLYSARAASPLPPDQILITPGAIMANHLTLFALVGAGDHVVCHHPTYQQLYSTPASFGAEVDLWRAVPEKNWVPDIEDLKSLIKPHTKLIIIK
jgi:aspartate/methionine/tyrosine aminotransferase